jgi:hypothetical protein
MINIVFPYFNNGQMLLRHIEEWNKYEHPEDWNLVITDDCSLQDPISNYLNHLQAVPFNSIQVFAIKTDIAWNQDGARNLCFRHIENEWCVSTDADHILNFESAKTLGSIIEKDCVDTDQYFRFLRADAANPGQIIEKFHPNSYLIHSHLYWKCGGYDEKLSGYYGKDANFRRRISIYGKDSGFLPHPIRLIRYTIQDIPDANTTVYGRKNTNYHVRQYEDLKKISLSLEKPNSWLNFEWERLC